MTSAAQPNCRQQQRDHAFTDTGSTADTGATSRKAVLMNTKIAIVFDNPHDPAAFEAGYGHVLALAKQLPGLRGLETAKVWPKEDGSATPASRLMDLHFDDYEAASRAVATEEAAAFFPAALSLATGGVRMMFAHVEEAVQYAPHPG